MGLPRGTDLVAIELLKQMVVPAELIDVADVLLPVALDQVAVVGEVEPVFEEGPQVVLLPADLLALKRVVDVATAEDVDEAKR